MNTQRQHPVALYALNSQDKDYHVKDAKGRSPRFLVEQLDGDQFGFPSREDAEEFMNIHGMVAVSDVEIERLRQEMDKK